MEKLSSTHSTSGARLKLLIPMTLIALSSMFSSCGEKPTAPADEKTKLENLSKINYLDYFFDMGKGVYYFKMPDT